jgi:hypothetical protein
MAKAAMPEGRGGRAPANDSSLEQANRVVGAGSGSTPGAGEALLIDPVSRCRPEKTLQGSE